jgi:putative nucleotidyltransferase with HDIG domain
MLLSIAILMIALLAWQTPFGSQVQLEAGDVAPYDVVSPSRISYESDFLTEQARNRAEASIADQYDASEGRIRRQQVTLAREVLEFITIVRDDPYASPELQADYLFAIDGIELTPEAVTRIINISDSQWSQVVQEVPAALDRAMRDEIRDNTLAVARNRVPSVIDAALDEEASAVTIDLVRALLRANSTYNGERTEFMRSEAAAAVPIQTETIEAGEIIIRAGDKADELAVEALTQLGVLQEQWDWWTLLRATLFILILLAMTVGLIYRLRPDTLVDLKEQSIVIMLLVIWLLGAKFMIVPHDWLPYLYPLAAFGMLITVFLDLRIGVVLTVMLLFFIQYLNGNNLILLTYLGIGTLIGAVILGRVERLVAFLWAGVAITISNLLIMASYHAPYSAFAPQAMLQLQLMSGLNAVLAASIALIGYFVIGNLFGITTSLQLTELSRPTHPLLRQLLLKSPGTYHHTIVVSNMAERAAAAIGADAFLTRVGAYYHDIGKTVRPYFFTENIADGVSPHDKLDPHTSAQVIISHVTDGLDLAEKYHLPPRIRDFIREHHGDSLVQYFYIKAQNNAAEDEMVNEAEFRYPGPNPRSKETAILMLADTCEAAVRSIRPPNRDALRELVDRLIDERVANGELDNSDLTFRELQTVKDVFLRVLEGVNHPRISYPERTGRSVGENAPATAAAGRDDVAVASAVTANDAPQPNGHNAPAPGGVEEFSDSAKANPQEDSGGDVSIMLDN